MAAPVFSTGDVPTAQQVNDWFVNVLFKRKTLAETISSSATLQNDDDLFVTVAATAVYEISLELQVLAQPSNDFKMSFTGPAGYAMDYAARGPITTAAGLADTYSISGTTGDVLSFGGIASNDLVVSLHGLVVTSGTSGTLQLQWAQLTSGASGTTLQPGSFISLRRVA